MAHPCVFCHSADTSVSSVQRSVIVEKTWFIRCETCGRLFDVVGTADVLSADDKQRVAEIERRLQRWKAWVADDKAIQREPLATWADSVDFLLALVQRLAGDDQHGE